MTPDEARRIAINIARLPELLRRIPPWEAALIGKEGHRYGTVEARDEREATAKTAEEFEIPPELRFKIAVTRLADKK